MEHKAKWPVRLHQSSSIHPMMMIMITTVARNRRFINAPLGLASGVVAAANAAGMDEVRAGLANTLYFSVGINDENDGLYGAIAPTDGL